MSNVRFQLSTGSFLQNWSNAGQITANDDWSGVPSIVGFLGDTNAGSPTGVDPRTLTANDASAIDVIANQTNPNITNGGVAEFAITDPTIALQGSGTADSPYIVIYLDATGRQDINFQCNIRDIDASADDAIQQVVVQYRTSPTGAWTNIHYIADATLGGSATLVNAVNVTLPADANNAPQLEIRIMTTNAAGNDEWVGIDDINISSNPNTGPAAILSINDVSIAEGNSGTTDMTFTVTRTGSTVGTSEATYTVNGVTANSADFAGGLPITGTVSFADGQSTATITIQIAGDTATEGNETFTVDLSAPVNATISDASGLGTINNDDFSVVQIYDIQGASHTSTFVGQTVTTTGIVTAVDTNGYYIQSAAGDGNDATSDAIFIFTSSAPGRVVGDSVTVTGVVQEFLPGGSSANLTFTQISSTGVVVNSTGNALPAATLIGTGGRLPPTDVFDNDGFSVFDPENDAADFYESLEGMRVTIDNPLVTSATNSFGETWVVASGGVGATGVNSRGGITISGNDDNFDDYNPERIQIDDDSGLFAGFSPNYSQGDILSSVTGVVNYNFQSYEVLVTEAVSIVTDAGAPSEEVTTLAGSADRVTLATYNVENLDPTDGARFDDLADDIVDHLGSPDIIGLNEIQDADGAGTGSNLSGQATADALIAAIIAAGGPAYTYVEVAPTVANSTGGEPGGNIRNGFLYNAARVSYVPGSAEAVPGSAFNNSRPPLSAEFVFNGQTITAISVHSTSRGGSDPLFGATQPPVNAGDTARTAQATAVRAYIDGILAANPDAHIAVTGDFNGFSYESAIEAITAGGVMTDASSLIAVEDRYSYLFEGNLQLLDHILLSSGLMNQALYDAVHINSEQADAIRATDHDPQLVSLLVLAAASGWTAGADVGTNAATNNDINGLAGIDMLDMSSATNAITVVLNGTTGVITGVDVGTDTVRNIEQFTLGSGDDSFYAGNNPGGFVRAGAGNDQLYGGTASDQLAGGEGNDTIRGGTGAANTLIGNAGDDTYIVSVAGDTIVELVGEGTDAVQTGLSAFVLAANIETLTFTGSGAFVGIGNAEANEITGGVNSDQLYGLDGNDQIYGGLGAANTLVGGLGNDSYYVDAVGDTIVELVGEGIDFVYTRLASFTLSANVDYLYYIGTESFSGTGNELNNVIIGGEQADTLHGLDGNDEITGSLGAANTIVGGLGDDIYIVQAAGDTTVELAGEGIDSVYSTLSSHVLQDNIENLLAHDGADFVGIGNALGNFIQGREGDDFLSGLDGDDRLSGVTGDDILFGGAGADTFMLHTSGVDRILDFNSGEDRIELGGALAAIQGSLQLVSGSGSLSATTADTTILYDTSTGNVFYDYDGNGVGAAVQIANIGAGTVLVLGDFITTP